jgi:protein phosphatase 2C family protein 2/3
VIEAGGKIYQTTAISSLGGKLEQFIGPLRVYPGRLSTTRTFGDFEAKDPKTGGNPKVVISEPEITSFTISEHDLIIIGSDGLWDRIDNR